MNKNIFAVILAASQLLSLNVFADEEAVAAQESVTAQVATIQHQYDFRIGKTECVDSPNDPFDPGNQTVDGLDWGRCTDNHEERVPVIISETDDAITIANFRHARAWWYATIPKKGIEEVYLQTATFNIKGNKPSDIAMKIVDAGHVQIRFVMNPNTPVVLKPQVIGDNSKPLTLDSFVASPEPFGVKDNKDGLGQQRFLTRFVSEIERGTDEVGYAWNSLIDQTELNLDPEQKKTLIEVAIRRSIRRGYSSHYSAFQENCAVESIAMLAEAFPPKSGKMPNVKIRLATALNPIVGATHKALLQLGLIDKDSAHYSLEDEYSSGAPFLENMAPITNDPDEKKGLQKQVTEEPSSG